MFTLVAMGGIALFGQVPLWCLVVLLGLPIPLLAYALFRRLTGHWHWGALLALALIFGTSLLPVLDKVLRGVTAYAGNHVLAVIGLLIFLHEFFGRRRVAVAGIGLIIATLSRQLSFAFVIPFIWMAWHPMREEHVATGRTQPGRRIALAGLLALAAVLPYPILNTLKFGSPLETGYDLIYEGRTDQLAQAARTHGVFSTHFIPRNLWYMNVGPPRVHQITMAGREEIHIRPNQQGTGIWWTTPLLLFLFPALPEIWRGPGRRWLLIGCGLVFSVLMLFHNTGALQRGYNRFSLDFVPVLMALVAPICVRHKWKRWISVVLIIWSVVYFRILIPPDPTPDWWALP